MVMNNKPIDDERMRVGLKRQVKYSLLFRLRMKRTDNNRLRAAVRPIHDAISGFEATGRAKRFPTHP